MSEAANSSKPLKNLKSDVKRSVGRPKGMPNKPKECVAELCERLGFNPFELLIHIGKSDHKALGYETADITKRAKSGETFVEDRISLDQRLKAAAQLTSHVAPVLKAVEVNANVVTSASDEDKQLIAAYKAEVMELAKLSARK